MTLLFFDFDFFSDLQGRFGWFVNLLLSYIGMIKKFDDNLKSFKENQPVSKKGQSGTRHSAWYVKSVCSHLQVYLD